MRTTGSTATNRALFPTLMLAEAIARVAHHGRVDKSNQPYIRHLERVAELVPIRDYDAKCAAWLHDVMEDAPDIWEAVGCLFSARVRAIVDTVSRRADESYDAFIARIAASGDRWAIAVKLIDLRDNLRPGCPASLRARYHAAIQVLESARAAVAVDPVATS